MALLLELRAGFRRVLQSFGQFRELSVFQNEGVIDLRLRDALTLSEYIYTKIYSANISKKKVTSRSLASLRSATARSALLR